MEEIQSQSDTNISPSPPSRVHSSNFFYIRKLGATRKPISYGDSPEWEDTDLDVRLEEERGGVCVVWKDLTVSISGKRKYFDKVVKSSSGFAVPGTKIVIMGSARSGKSTLLRAIAGYARNWKKGFTLVVKWRLELGVYLELSNEWVG
ncbi:ABC transporter G family member 3 [Linum perenne]